MGNMFFEIDDKSSILVVDLDSRFREQLDEMFNGSKVASLTDSVESLNYVIHGCASSAGAIGLCGQAIAKNLPYKMVFVETQLQGGDCGLSLIQQLWLLDPDLQVVIYTQDDTLTWERIMETVGQSDQLLILQKPCSQLELRQIVHATIRKWQLVKQSQNIMQFLEQQVNERTAKINEANKSLLQAEKLAAVGQLAAGVAHEINTPAQYVGDNIRVIRDFFESLARLISVYRPILQETLTVEKSQEIRALEEQEDLDYILEDAPLAITQSLEGITQISQIVQAMKGFAYLGQSRLTLTDINKAIKNTLLVAKNNYKYVADVETEFDTLNLIECFPGELNQVFLNIIVNAAHAIEESHKGQGKIRIVTRQLVDAVEIRISDTGIGIPEKIKDRIFDPFFTTKEVGKGSGQGLNIAYRIICEQHHGALKVESEENVGSTFIIQLPLQLPPN